MDTALWVVGIATVLFALDRLGLWLEAKGWLYYRKIKRKGSAGGVFTGPDVFDPGVRHLETALEEHIVEEEDDGDDDGRRKRRDRVS